MTNSDDCTAVRWQWALRFYHRLDPSQDKLARGARGWLSVFIHRFAPSRVLDLRSGGMMVDLDSSTPCFYWTFDDFEDLKLEHNRERFGGSVWKSNAISSYAIGAFYLTFDAPEEWGEGSRPVHFARTADGLYEHHSEDTTYSGVRADTQTHIVLTGRWTETDYGRGVFILVLPIKTSEQIREPLMEAVPVGRGAQAGALAR